MTETWIFKSYASRADKGPTWYGMLTEAEFLENSNIEDKEWAKELFRELDPQGRGASTIPEYLKTYGNWAR